MMDKLNTIKPGSNQLQQEVAYVYQNEVELKKDLESKNKRVFEIPKERPKWFNSNLLTKIRTEK